MKGDFQKTWNPCADASDMNLHELLSSRSSVATYNCHIQKLLAAFAGHYRNSQAFPCVLAHVNASSGVYSPPPKEKL
jgi:hypothetical protein